MHAYQPDSSQQHWFSLTDADRDPLRAYLTVQNAATRGPADLWVEKDLLSADTQVGGQLVHRIEAYNIGGQPAPGAVLTDSLPAGVSLVSESRGDGQSLDRELVWDLGHMESGAREIITLTLQLADGGQPGGYLTNTLRAGPSPGEPYLDDNAASVTTLLPDLGIHKTAHPVLVGPGQALSLHPELTATAARPSPRV